MSEVVHYLKGIRQEDVEKIPIEFRNNLKNNCYKEYKCDFDYTLPLKDLNLMPETRGIISMICYKYWCESPEQKKKFMNILQQNEERYQETLREKYNPDNIFNSRKIS